MPTDLDALQGTWRVVALELGGVTLPGATLAEAKIVIAASKFTSLGMGADYSGTIAVGGAADPKKLDLHFETGPQAGRVNRGIYKLEGNRLTLCLAMIRTDAPTRFATTPGDGNALEVLTRVT
jgi:uncharacterized protein (TIGR03067 family)